MNKTLLKRRLNLKLSKRQASKLAKLDRTTISNAENGKNITLATYNAINNLYTMLEGGQPQ